MPAAYQYNIFVFDIETIPQEELTVPLWQELERKTGNEVVKISENEETVRLRLQSVNPAFGRIFCIAVLYRSMNSQGVWEEAREVFYDSDEKALLSNFWRRLADFSSRRTLFVSFNGLRFDVPFIIARTLAQGLPQTNKLFLDTYRYGRFPHFDACFALENQMTLEAACEMLGLDSPKTEDIRGSQVYEYYKRGQILAILNYCLRDVESTHEIFRKIQPFYPLSYADERKAKNWSQLKGTITPIPDRSPGFECISCGKTFYPEGLDFCEMFNDFACLNCKRGLERADLEAIGLGDYTGDIQKYTWAEYLSNKTQVATSSPLPSEFTDDDIPF